MLYGKKSIEVQYQASYLCAMHRDKVYIIQGSLKCFEWCFHYCCLLRLRKLWTKIKKLIESSWFIFYIQTNKDQTSYTILTLIL